MFNTSVYEVSLRGGGPVFVLLLCAIDDCYVVPCCVGVTLRPTSERLGLLKQSHIIDNCLHFFKSHCIVM